MKRSILVVFLSLIVYICLTACGLENNKLSIGDMVSTDLVEFTIENSKLTLALDSEGNVKDYDEKNKDKYVAAKGHVYVSLTFILKNLDRSKLELNNGFMTAKYNGKESNILEVVSMSEDLAKWDEYRASKIVLDTGKELTYRAYIDMDNNSENLEDDFEIAIKLPTSDGTTKEFKFLINKTARENAKPREISLETAIERYSLDATIEYFEKHIDDFETLNDSQITEFVRSNDGDRYIKFGYVDYIHYEFLEKKKGADGNLRVWPGGTGASSFMYSMEEWNVQDNTLKINSRELVVKKLNEKHYLLIDKSDNSIAGLIK